MLLSQMVNIMEIYLVAPAVWAFFSQYRALIIILGILLILGISATSIFLKKKKKKKHEVIHPVTDIVGSEAERLEELNKDLESFGFAYDPYEDVFYSLMNPWQRQMGYCRLYDEAAAAMSMIIDCEPIRFEYFGKKWMIELWKGQYGMTTGGEVGIYYTTGPEVNIPGIFNGTFYHCVKDEDRINMSFILRKNGNILFTRSGLHWWLTGFKLGEFSDPSQLTMDITLDLYDRQMANIFVEALRKVGYKENEYGVQGRRVYIHFSKPHSGQPLSRTSFTEFVMQKNNENLCDAYNTLTQAYVDTLDKLVIVRKEAPNMYNQILSIGKPKAVYDAYKGITTYIESED